LIAIPNNQVENTVKVFNLLHKRLQFLAESSYRNQINFLNVLIIWENNKFVFDLYFKPTFSGRFLNFMSHHPASQKRNIIYGLVDKVYNLSHPKFHQKNLQYIIQVLLNNGYLLPYIFSNINKRIKHILKSSKDDNKNNKKGNKKKKHFCYVLETLIAFHRAIFSRNGNSKNLAADGN